MVGCQQFYFDYFATFDLSANNLIVNKSLQYLHNKIRPLYKKLRNNSIHYLPSQLLFYMTQLVQLCLELNNFYHQ